MFGVAALSRTQRLILGVFVLLLVNVIWVASSEMTEYLFSQKHYGKPYFSTYVKTSMCLLYLSGFIVWRSWWLQCRKNSVPHAGDKEANGKKDSQKLMKKRYRWKKSVKLLSDPVYVPIKFDDKIASNSSSESDLTSNGNMGPSRSVRFNNLSEVRQLSDSHAEDASLARLSYSAYVRAEEARVRAASKLTVKQIAKVAVIFCFVFFFGNLSYQEAMNDTKSSGIVNVLSSTSGLFTLILAAIFPSTSGDRLSLSKFVAVAISIGGVVLVSLSDHILPDSIPLGALWALSSALLYAVYLVLIRRRVDNEEKLNIPMFFGFVGLFTALFLWPGLLVLHISSTERFEWPDTIQWIFLVLNGMIGTVVTQLLWLWGCFLTSSLVATLSLTLTVPMTMLADLIIKDVDYNWMFYLGTGPVFLSFFAVSILSHYENWDPVLLIFKRLIKCFCLRRLASIPRLRDLDREQTESLIGINGERLET